MSQHDDSRSEASDRLLDEATRSLRETRVPKMPGSEFDADLVMKLRAADQKAATIQVLTLWGRFMAMKLQTRIAIAAIALGAFLGVFSWVLPGSDQLAFGDLLEAIEAVKTAQWEVTMESFGPEGKITTHGVGKFMAPALERMEFTSENEPSISIADYSRGEVLSLIPTTKVAVTQKLVNLPSGLQLSGSFQGLREMAKGGTKGSRGLGEAKIDGRRAIGFNISTGVGEAEIWSDHETGLPVRVEFRSRTPKTRTLMTNFQVNPPLKREEFNLEVPAGYIEQELSFDLSGSPERFVVTMLRAAAKHNGDVFPDELLGDNGLDGFAKKIIAAEVEEHGPGSQEATKAILDLSGNLGGAIGFVSTIPEEDRRYLGKGVRLNERDRPILWYRLRGKDTFRVIYADLSAKDAAQPPE